MVRGLDYYTKTTFEFVHDGLGAQSGHRRRRALRRADGHPRRAAAVRASASASASTAPCWPAGPRASRPGRRPAARCSGCRWATPAQAPARRARRAAAPGRGARRPGLRRPRAQGRDEGRRPLRRPARPGARRARPRGRHDRGQGPGVRRAAVGAAGRRCSTTARSRPGAERLDVAERPTGSAGTRGTPRVARAPGAGAAGRAARAGASCCPPAGRALDVACGRGAVAVWLAVRGFAVDAVDVSAGRAGRRRASSRPGTGVAERVRWWLHDLDAGLPAGAPGPTTWSSASGSATPRCYPAAGRAARAGRAAGGDRAVRGRTRARAVPRAPGGAARRVRRARGARPRRAGRRGEPRGPGAAHDARYTFSPSVKSASFVSRSSATLTRQTSAIPTTYAETAALDPVRASRSVATIGLIPPPTMPLAL